MEGREETDGVDVVLEEVLSPLRHDHGALGRLEGDLGEPGGIRVLVVRLEELAGVGAHAHEGEELGAEGDLLVGDEGHGDEADGVEEDGIVRGVGRRGGDHAGLEGVRVEMLRVVLKEGT